MGHKLFVEICHGFHPRVWNAGLLILIEVAPYRDQLGIMPWISQAHCLEDFSVTLLAVIGFNFSPRRVEDANTNSWNCKVWLCPECGRNFFRCIPPNFKQPTSKGRRVRPGPCTMNHRCHACFFCSLDTACVWDHGSHSRLHPVYLTLHACTDTHTLSEAVLWPRLAVKTEKHPKMLRATRAVLNLVFSLMYCAVNLPVSSKCTCFQLDLAYNRFGVGPPYFIIHQDVMCTWAIGTHVAELKIRTIVRTWAPLTYRASCVAYDFLEPLPAKPRKEYALPWLLHEKEPVNSQHA